MKKILISLFAIIYLIFYLPSLFIFYTHDDFFHLNISKFESLGDFFGVFNLAAPYQDFGYYRPLSTQVFYGISRYFFDNSPIPLHIISFILFFAGAKFLYDFIYLLSRKKQVAMITTILYLGSAIHFAHHFFMATQELPVFLFSILASLNCLKYFAEGKINNLIAGLCMFVLALMSKEVAVVLPAGILLSSMYMKENEVPMNLRKLILTSSILFAMSVVYAYLHFFAYGIINGDSYVMDFSIAKTLNSTFWYGAWVIGIPEMFVDFVGSGLKVDPRLFLYWGAEAYFILTIFVTTTVTLTWFILIALKRFTRKTLVTVAFSAIWFIVFLTPFLFFPFHKFSHNLTLASVGVFYLIAEILSKMTVKYQAFLLICFISLNMTSLYLTKKTHWVTGGAEISKNVYEYFLKNRQEVAGKTIVFYDTESDNSLPWKPTTVVRQSISDRNFFEVFFPEVKDVKFEDGPSEGGDYFNAGARQFLPY